MEIAYYVTHPTWDKSAVVYAPSTEKARTTLLDYLERRGLIHRRNRQAFRKDMIAERLEDPNVPSDIVLHYGYRDATPSKVSLDQMFEDRPFKESEPTEIKEPDELPDFREETSLDEELVPPPELGIESKPKMMPVQQVMLKGYV